MRVIEFSLKVKVMESNPDYLLKYFLLFNCINYLESIASLTTIFSIVCEEKAHHDSSRKRAWVSLHLGLPTTVTLPLCRRRRWGRRHAAASSCCRRSLFMSALYACMWCGGGGGGTALPFFAQPCPIMPRQKMQVHTLEASWINCVRPTAQPVWRAPLSCWSKINHNFQNSRAKVT